MKKIFALTVLLFILTGHFMSCASYSKTFELEYKVKKEEFLPSPVSPFDKYRPKLGIAFSGGGPVKGMAHLGIIRVFEENGITPDYITGTSMGSIVGSLYALGYNSREIENFIKNMNWIRIMTGGPNRQHTMLSDYEQRSQYVISMQFSKYYELEAPIGLVQGHYVLASLNQIAYRGALIRDFDKFKIPFRVNIVDLGSGSEEVVNRGYIVEDLRASSSLPIFFDPFIIGENMYVDGGLASNMQCDVVKAMGSDIVIGAHIPADKMNKDQIKSLFNVLSQTITFNSDQRLIENEKIADIIIEPDVSGCGYFTFTDIDESVDQGRIAAEKAMPGIKEMINNRTTLEVRSHDVDVIIFNDPGQISEQNSKLEVPGRISEKQIYDELKRLYNTGNYEKVSARIDGRKLTFELAVMSPLKKVAFKHNSVFNESTLRNLINLGDGERINKQVLNKGLGNILKHYQNDGFLMARIKDVGIKDGVITISLDEGRIGELVIEGVEEYPEYFISEKLKNIRGKVFSHNEIQDILNAIYSQGYFKYLYYKTDEVDGDIRVTIMVREKGTNTIAAGFSLDTDRNLRVLLGLNLTSLSGYKYQVGNRTVFGRNPETNFNIVFYPSPLFSYFSAESNIFWNRTNAFIDSGAVRTPMDVDRYGANIKGSVHLTAWDNTSVGLMTRYLDSSTYTTAATDHNIVNNGATFVESKIDLIDKFVLPGGDFMLYYKANNYNDQNEFFLDNAMAFDFLGINTISIGKTTGRVEKYYSFENMFLLGGAGSLIGWSNQSIMTRDFDITHVKYRMTLYTDPNSLMQNAYLNVFYDEGRLDDAINIDREMVDINGDVNLSGWGVGIEGESVLNLLTMLNYEYSKENKGRIYLKIGNNF